MNIGIIGAGVVGGATGKVLSSHHEVMYYDKFKAPYNRKENLETIARKATVAFVCVPTPMQPNGAMDYSTIYNSLHDLLECFSNEVRNPRELITVIRSTAVSGTTDTVAQQFPFRFAFNPEFLREKHAEDDMKNTTRVVIGTNEEEVCHTLTALYRVVFPDANYNCVSIKTAEMIKYAANVMLASQVAIANELYRVCEGVGVEYDEVKRAILYDPRIGRNIDVPGHDGGFGFGGKCFPKDLRALIYLAREHNVDTYLFEEVWRSNLTCRTKKDWLEILGATSGNNFS